MSTTKTAPRGETLGDLDTTTGVATKEDKTIELRSGRDFLIVKTALEHRAEELDKLAKKAEEGGYPKEAKAIRTDADVIKHEIAPKFGMQRAVDLGQHDRELRTAVLQLVQRQSRRLELALKDARGDEKRIKAAWETMESDLVREVARGYEAAARAGFVEGEAARELTASEIAVKALASLNPSAK